MSRPAVYARALNNRADSAAGSSSCTLTPLKSHPNRGSKKALAALFRECPALRERSVPVAGIGRD
jgi:hypothetical protein